MICFLCAGDGAELYGWEPPKISSPLATLLFRHRDQSVCTKFIEPERQEDARRWDEE